VSVYTIFKLSLERDPISARCSWKRHSEEHSTEDVVLLGAVLRVLPNGTPSGSAGLGGREHLMKRSDDTRPVMKMVMISRRGDGGGKEFL
jgi:hypothetical protein